MSTKISKKISKKKTLKKVRPEPSKNATVRKAAKDMVKKPRALKEVLPTKDELKVANEKLTLQLAQTNMQLDQFAHTTSHEFQEPLRKIIYSSKALQDKVKRLKPEVVKTQLHKIEMASIRLKKLIEDMLNFTSVTNYEKLLVKTDLNEILKNIIFDFELLIEEKKGKVKSHKLPTIEAVPFQMNQLFYDIVHNALKFSKADVPPRIDISSRKLTAKDLKLHPHLNHKLKYYEIIFKDNGIGFDQKYAEQIFTMFQRLSAGGAYGGTGIGLAICKKIVQTYFGEIYVEGVENRGAMVHVILPVRQPVKIPEDLSTVLKTWL